MRGPRAKAQPKGSKQTASHCVAISIHGHRYIQENIHRSIAKAVMAAEPDKGENGLQARRRSDSDLAEIFANQCDSMCLVWLRRWLVWISSCTRMACMLFLPSVSSMRRSYVSRGPDA